MREDAGTLPPARAVLVAEVRGYSSFARARGGEAAARLAARFAETMHWAAEDRAGVVLELGADEAVCTFPTTRAAFMCAADAQRAFAALGGSDPSLPLRVGMAIDAGDDAGVASRLCRLAEPGRVIATARAAERTQGVEAITFVDRGPVVLKGIREAVQRYDATFPAAPARPETPSSWTAGRLAVAAVGVIAALAAAVAIAATQLASHRIRSLDPDAVGELAGSSGRILAQTRLAAAPGGAAFGLGRLWVAEPAASRVLGIDPASGVAVESPSGGAGPAGVAVAGGAVWVVDAGDGTVRRIDPELGAPDGPPVPVGAGAAAVTAGAGAAWVTNPERGTVRRIDARTLAVSAPIHVGAQPVAAVYGFGSLWVADAADGVLVRVDPASGRVAAEAAVGVEPAALAVGFGRVWVVDAAAGAVVRVDPDAPDRQRRVAVAAAPSAVAAAGRWVWVASRSGVLSRIDPRTLETSPPRRIAPALAGLVAGGGRLWATTVK